VQCLYNQTNIHVVTIHHPDRSVIAKVLLTASSTVIAKTLASELIKPRVVSIWRHEHASVHWNHSNSTCASIVKAMILQAILNTDMLKLRIKYLQYRVLLRNGEDIVWNCNVCIEPRVRLDEIRGPWLQYVRQGTSKKCTKSKGGSHACLHYTWFCVWCMAQITCTCWGALLDCRY